MTSAENLNAQALEELANVYAQEEHCQAKTEHLSAQAQVVDEEERVIVLANYCSHVGPAAVQSLLLLPKIVIKADQIASHCQLMLVRAFQAQKFQQSYSATIVLAGFDAQEVVHCRDLCQCHSGRV